MRSPAVFHKVEIVCFGGFHRGFDGSKGDGTDRIWRQSFELVGVKTALVAAYPLRCDLDVGVSAIIERTIHLQCHPFSQTVVNDRMKRWASLQRWLPPFG